MCSSVADPDGGKTSKVKVSDYNIVLIREMPSNSMDKASFSIQMGESMITAYLVYLNSAS